MNVVDITLIPAIAGTSWFEVVLVAAEDRAGASEEQQRQQEVEERGARVAPEHPALEAVLAPAEGERVRHRRSAPGRRPRASGAPPTAPPGARRARAPRAVSSCSSAVGSSVCVLDQLAVAVAVGDAVVGCADAELARRPDREHAAVLDDRHAVGQLLRLVEVVRRQQDRLAERRAASAPSPRRRGAPPGRSPSSARRGRSARGRRPARARSPAAAAARRRACGCARRPCPRARPAPSTSSTSRGLRVEARPVAQRLARRDVAVDAAGLQHDADPPAQLDRAARGVVARAPTPRRRCARGSPRGSPPSSSCRRRWARAGRTPRRG